MVLSLSCTRDLLLRMFRFFQGIAAVGTVSAAVAYASCFVVRPGECGVLYNRLSGIRDHVYHEGIQLRVPGLEDVKMFDVRLRPRLLNTMTGTKDLQMVNIRLRVLFRPEAEHLPNIYRNLGMDYDERVLPSVTNEILKAVVAEFQAEELIVKREKVSERVRELMREKVKEFHIILDDISLVDIQFGKEFMQAVESKQVAQQEAERFKFVVMENEQRKRAAVIRAEGEAEAAKLISSAIAQAGNGLIELRRIETAKEIASDLAAAPHVQFVPHGGSVLLGLGAK